jgi:hypothetical protein
MKKLFKPNKYTEIAIRRPIAYSLSTGLLFAAFAITILAASVGKTVALIVALVGGLGFIAMNLMLWRPRGAGVRWAERADRSSDDDDKVV